MPRYSKSRKGAGNPAPTAAHKARRKGVGRVKVSVSLDKEMLEQLDSVLEQHPDLSRSEALNQAIVMWFNGKD